MSNSSIDKATYGAFGIGCMIVIVAALLLAVAIGIFFGPGWAFLSLALFVLSLGLSWGYALAATGRVGKNK